MSQGWGQPPQQPPYGAPPSGFGAPPGQGYGPPPGQGYGPPQAPQSASGMATAALILGLISWVVGGIFVAIPGVIIGKMELNKIARGESPEAGKSYAQIGYWASLANIIFFVVIMCGVCALYAAFFGFAMVNQPSGSYSY